MDDDRQRERIIIGLVLGVACIAGGGYLLYDSFQATLNAEEVDAEVLESDVSGTSGTEREFRVRVTYEYSYEGQTYTSDNIYPSTGGDRYSSQGSAESFLEEYPEGKTVTAYVNPDDPSEAFLESEVRMQMVIAYLFVIVLGIVALGAAVKQIRSPE